MVDSGPISERQLRSIAKLEPQQQREAWAKAVETAPDGKVTASAMHLSPRIPRDHARQVSG